MYSRVRERLFHNNSVSTESIADALEKSVSIKDHLGVIFGAYRQLGPSRGQWRRSENLILASEPANRGSCSWKQRGFERTRPNNIVQSSAPKGAPVRCLATKRRSTVIMAKARQMPRAVMISSDLSSCMC